MSEAGELDRDGFVIVRGVLDRDEVAELITALEPIMKENPSAGIRGLAQKVPRIRALVDSHNVRRLVEPIVGPDAEMVRSVLFN